MLDIQYIKSNPEELKENMRSRNLDDSLVDKLIELEKERTALRQQIEENNRNKNKTAEELKTVNDKTSPESLSLIKKGKKIKDNLKELEDKFLPVEKEFQRIMYLMPNVHAPDMPVGKNEDENIVIEKIGKTPEFNFKIKDHYELGVKLNLIDKESAAKVSGARFAYLKADLILLQFALIQYVLKTLTDKSIIEDIIKRNNLKVIPTAFIPVVPPVLIKTEVLEKMGRLDPREDRYDIGKDDLYLIGSAEHTLGPLHMDNIFEEKDLPVRYLGYSTSFRREAGTYGKDMTGIFRMHQFDKLEMETFTLPEDSLEEQNLLVAIQKYLMTSLELPFQVVMVCTGDTGKPDARQIDIETWIPSQNKYRETHSADLMTDFQSRRLNIKVRRADQKTQFVHMNDATAFAIGRILIAIMENNQKEDGSIKVPGILTPYISNNTDEVYISPKV